MSGADQRRRRANNGVFAGLRWPFRLSAATYGTLWEYDNRGPQHSALFVDTPIRFGAELLRAESRALAELDTAGLLLGTAMHPDVRAALDLINHAEQEFYCWSSTSADHRVSAVVAAGEFAAVFAMLAKDTVYFEPAEPNNPIEELLGLLPAVPMAIGTSINVHYTEATAQHDPTIMQTNRHTSRTAQEKLTALMGEPRSNLTEFHAARRDNGERKRARYPLRVIDTESGRWMLKRTADWITATPADHHLVARTIADMAARLAAPPGEISSR